ncbi:unnamed protein product [Larinioides sclopetarius]|uniref:Uncharacterized protein n=1 Tax=Larinioides sclopetarius TaxID=280406 RepID=A0AAV2AUX3_9ARAC
MFATPIYFAVLFPYLSWIHLSETYNTNIHEVPARKDQHLPLPTSRKSTLKPNLDTFVR